MECFFQKMLPALKKKEKETSEAKEKATNEANEKETAGKPKEASPWKLVTWCMMMDASVFMAKLINIFCL